MKQKVQKLRRGAENPQSPGDGNTTTESGASPAGGQKRKGAGGGRKASAGKKAKTEEKLKVEAEIDDVEAKGVKDEED